MAKKNVNKEKFLAGEPFVIPEGKFNYRPPKEEAKTKYDSKGHISETDHPFGGHVGNVEYITPTRVEIYSYWMKRKLCKVIKFEDMNFDINE